ncbi:MAG: hypothetical protein N3B13_01500 [Deltaproteobacteria bacterium]|nr:hypothetical protein [Deltaproteobacteria bacterium]
MLKAISIYLMIIFSQNVSFRETEDLGKLMKAMDECIMFSPEETKAKIRKSRLKALLPDISIGGRFEENDLEANKLAESSPYLLTNFKSGWAVEVGLKWSLDSILFSKDELSLKKEYQDSLDKYIALQNTLSDTYHKLTEILKKMENSTDDKERYSLEKEYKLLNSRINILTCHKYKTIHKKED